MNYPAYITLAGWETRNWRHRDKALVWCKDYGLVQITKHVFSGELYTRERREIETKFKSLFSGKTEKFFFATMCRSCFNGGMTGMPIRKRFSGTDNFELIQLSGKA